MIEYLDVLFPALKVTRSDAAKEERLTDFERCLLTIMFFKTDRDEADLKYVWGVSSKVVTRCVCVCVCGVCVCLCMCARTTQSITPLLPTPRHPTAR